MINKNKPGFLLKIKEQIKTENDLKWYYRKWIKNLLIFLNILFLFIIIISITNVISSSLVKPNYKKTFLVIAICLIFIFLINFLLIIIINKKLKKYRQLTKINFCKNKKNLLALYNNMLNIKHIKIKINNFNDFFGSKFTLTIPYKYYEIDSVINGVNDKKILFNFGTITINNSININQFKSEINVMNTQRLFFYRIQIIEIINSKEKNVFTNNEDLMFIKKRIKEKYMITIENIYKINNPISSLNTLKLQLKLLKLINQTKLIPDVIINSNRIILIFNPIQINDILDPANKLINYPEELSKQETYKKLEEMIDNDTNQLQSIQDWIIDWFN